MARAKTPATPAMLATTAAVGAGAPPVELELELDEPVAVEDADAAAMCEVAEALMELAAAVRDDATEDNGLLVVSDSPLLM